MEVDSIYSIDIPSYLSKTDAIHENARFQYRNRFRNVYLIITDVPKSEIKNSFEEYRSVSVKVITDFVQDSTVDGPHEKTINGLHASETFITGKVDDEKTFYDQVIIESEKNIYQICMWTKKDREETFEADMKKTIESFKEL